jgi:hypothetical protein
MTTTQSGSEMKLRSTDSTAGVEGSIPVNVRTRAKRAKGLRVIVAVAALSFAILALPGQAFAGSNCNDPTDCQYNEQVQQIASNLGSGGGGGGAPPAQRVAVPAASTGPSLPFTGLDVAALAVVALALAGTGVVLRRLATIGDSEK